MLLSLIISSRMLAILLAIFMICCCSISINAKDLKCSDIDALFNEMSMVSSTSRSFPINSEQMTEYCKKNTELSNQVGDLVKTCYQDTMKNLASLMLYAYRSRTKALCKNKNGRRAREYIEAAPCLNQYKQKISKCIDTSAYRLEAMQTQPNNHKFHYICCENIHFHRCVDKIPTGDCKAKVMSFAETAQSLLTGFIDRSCGDYNGETDKCDQLPSVTVNKASANKKPSLPLNAAALLASVDA